MWLVVCLLLLSKFSLPLDPTLPKLTSNVSWVIFEFILPGRFYISWIWGSKSLLMFGQFPVIFLSFWGFSCIQFSASCRSKCVFHSFRLHLSSHLFLGGAFFSMTKSAVNAVGGTFWGPLCSSAPAFLFDSSFMFPVSYPSYCVFHFSVFLWDFPIPQSLLKSFFGAVYRFYFLGVSSWITSFYWWWGVLFDYSS